MALSKNVAVADCLNSVRESNVESAATDAKCTELLSDYFGGPGSDGDDSVSSNVESECSESDNNDVDSVAGSVVIDEVAAVMDTVDIVDDEDSEAERRKIREFTCVNIIIIQYHIACICKSRKYYNSDMNDTTSNVIPASSGYLASCGDRATWARPRM